MGQFPSISTNTFCKYLPSISRIDIYKDKTHRNVVLTERWFHFRIVSAQLTYIFFISLYRGIVQWCVCAYVWVRVCLGNAIILPFALGNSAWNVIFPIAVCFFTLISKTPCLQIGRLSSNFWSWQSWSILLLLCVILSLNNVHISANYGLSLFQNVISTSLYPIKTNNYVALSWL